MYQISIKRLAAFLFILSTGAVTGTSQPLPFLADSVTYLWPTDSSTQLSSTFAETRAAHLHAGLDIRTWGREGYRVFATRDGVIHRIGMSPYGYGNVIYMKHNDGSYSVYAHLNRFEPELQAFADSIRFHDYSAQIDEVVEDAGLYYSQGDLIGFTGSTGVGPPHLHFELRTPEFKPFNPLLTNLRVRDTIPPVFRQLGIEHLHPRTLQIGRHEIKNATGSGNRYHFGEITASGPVGLSVNVHDRANDTPNVYAVHTLTMIHETDTLFHSQADYFAHEHRRQMLIDRAYPIFYQTRRGFQRLYQVTGNQLPFYHTSINRGVLHFEEGSYPIRIIASDIFGNRSEATLTLRFDGATTPPDEEITHVPPYPGLDTGLPGSLLEWNRKSLDPEAPMLVTSESTMIPFRRTPAPYQVGSPQVVEKTLIPGKKSILNTPDQKLWIEIPEDAIYDTLRLRMSVVEDKDEVRINFEPDRLPVNSPLRINYILPVHLRHNSQLSLFSIDQYRNRKFFLSSNNSRGVLRASMREISSLVLEEDNTPPWVGRPRIERNLAGNYLVIVPVRDTQTGIDFQRSRILVNGVRGLVEYDPEKAFLMYYNPEFVPSSRNELEIEVFDGAGNQTTLNTTAGY
jgi:hypothetical protein